jgi:hypothetical protein
MFDFFRLWCGAILRTFRSRGSLMLENVALRQQVVILKRKHPRPKLGPLDKLSWVVAPILASMERNAVSRFVRNGDPIVPLGKPRNS